MTLTFSVITPSYQQGQFIERTIQSVAQQGITDQEHVVCDGGSSDETVDILKKYNHLLRWVSEPDGGQADAVNKGIDMSSGDIIAWINSDDIYYPGAFEQVKNIFQDNPDVKIIYGEADHIGLKDEILEPYPTEPWNYKRLEEICFICQPAVFFRRSLIDQFGKLDATLKYCMDYELWLRFGQRTDFYHLRYKLAGSRLYDSNKTLGNRVPVHAEINTMLKQKLGQVSERWLFGYGYIKASKNFNNLDEKQKFRNYMFVSLLTLETIYSLLRWNHRISRKAAIDILEWWSSLIMM